MTSFDENGKYIKTNWKAGDKITATKLNKIEESIEAVNDNDISRHVEADARLDALEAKDVAHDKELTKVKNLIEDAKDAAELGDYEINSQLADITNIDNYFENDVLLIPSYSTDKNNNSEKDNLRLYITNDGVNLIPINQEKLFTSNTNKINFDYSCIYKDGKFIFISDYASGGVVGEYPGDMFNIITTSNFVDFEEVQIKFEGYARQWAPELFVDGSDIYIVSTLQVPNEQTSFYDFKMGIYLSKNIGDLSDWSSPIRINLPENDDMMYYDPFIIKHDNYYYLFIKKGSVQSEKENTIQQYRTSSLTENNWEFIQNINIFEDVEAPSVVKMNDKFMLYVDSHCDNKTSGRYLVLESYDLINWSEPKVINTPNNIPVRHFTPCLINSENKDIIAKAYMSLYKDNNSTIYSSYIKTLSGELYNKPNLIKSSLIRYSDTNVIDELTLNKDYLYILDINDGFNSIIINKFNTKNLFDGDRIYFQSNGTYREIIIKNDNLYLPKKRDFRIGDIYGNGEQVVEFIFRDGVIRPISDSPLAKQDFFSNLSYYNENLYEKAIDGVIDTLKINKNCIYNLPENFEGDITINKFDVSDMLKGEKFYFLVKGINRNLTIKHNSDNQMYMPSGVDFKIGYDYGNNDILLEFVVIDGVAKCMSTSYLAFNKNSTQKRNLVLNGDFINGKDGWFDLNGETSISSDGINGCRSIRIKANDLTSNKYIGCKNYLNEYSYYPCSTIFKLSYWYLCLNKSSFDSSFNVEIKATLEGSQTTIIQDEILKDDIIVDKWVYREKNFTIPYGATDVYIYPYLKRNGDVFVGNLKVELVD